MINEARLILVRHCESGFSEANLFTGWIDNALSPKGESQAREIGRKLRERNLTFDIAFTSIMSRAIKTCALILEELGQPDLVREQSWRLNERMYGDLESVNKHEAAEIFGEEQIQNIRRGYTTRPPKLDRTDSRHPLNNSLFDQVPRENVPDCESLEDIEKRMLPFLKESIFSHLRQGKSVLVVSHSNCLRAIVKYLNKMSPKDVYNLDIPRAIPLYYQMNATTLETIMSEYLEDPKTVSEATNFIKNEIHLQIGQTSPDQRKCPKVQKSPPLTVRVPNKANMSKRSLSPLKMDQTGLEVLMGQSFQNDIN